MIVSSTVSMTSTKGTTSPPMMGTTSPLMMGTKFSRMMGMKSRKEGLSFRSTAIAALGRLGLSRRALGLQYPSGLLVASFGAPGDEPDSFLSEEMKDEAFRTRRELETKYTSKDEEEGGRLRFEESQLGNLEVFAEEEPQEYEEEVKERKRRNEKAAK